MQIILYLASHITWDCTWKKWRAPRLSSVTRLHSSHIGSPYIVWFMVSCIQGCRMPKIVYWKCLACL